MAASADYRNSSGYVLSGPEFLTIFNGQNGAVLATTNYIPARGDVSSWGDSYGNRVDRFLAGVAYLDGQRPSLIMSRGYYTRAVIAAWDWRNGQLTQRWTFDSNASGNSAYAGQGNHNLSIADVDADGRQEIIFGAATIEDNGQRLLRQRPRARRCAACRRLRAVAFGDTYTVSGTAGGQAFTLSGTF